MIIVIICLIKVEFYVFYIKINFNIKIRLVGGKIEKNRSFFIFVSMFEYWIFNKIFFFFKDIKRIKFN